MADNNKNEQAEVLGPMHVDAAAFKAALKKAKENPVDCGIFDDWYKKHPEDRKEEKK